jgi:hypothetical protein
VKYAEENCSRVLEVRAVWDSSLKRICTMEEKLTKPYLRETESFLRSKHVLIQSRNSLHFMELESSSPHSQAPATCPYP